MAERISEIDVMPNAYPDMQMVETHIIPLIPLCPVSQNPREGSAIKITYIPKQFSLEVYSLKTFVDSFQGGKRINGGFVRDMEQTIQTIKLECELALEVAVTVEADLILEDQRMVLKV